MRSLTWWQGGLALGAVFLLAVVLVKPIGVSTQYVIADGIVWSWFDADLVTPTADGEGSTSSNAYLAKYADDIVHPLTYGLVFVVAMLLGGFLSARLGGPRVLREDRIAPLVWRSRFGDSAWPRYAAAFGGGLLALFGARLAGGCTSGHMMSGMMQTAASGYLFAAAVFAAGIPTAILLYRRSAGKEA